MRSGPGALPIDREISGTSLVKGRCDGGWVGEVGVAGPVQVDIRPGSGQVPGQGGGDRTPPWIAAPDHGQAQRATGRRTLRRGLSPDAGSGRKKCALEAVAASNDASGRSSALDVTDYRAHCADPRALKSARSARTIGSATSTAVTVPLSPSAVSIAHTTAPRPAPTSRMYHPGSGSRWVTRRRPNGPKKSTPTGRTRRPFRTSRRSGSCRSWTRSVLREVSPGAWKSARRVG
jgi:hypothetical protein